MPQELPYPINPDRSTPWNALPDLPIHPDLYRTVAVFEQLAYAKEALGRLQGRSVAIPNQGLLINSISLQEAKASSAIENIFTTDDELYRAFSESNIEQAPEPTKEILRYREALWTGFHYLKTQPGFDLAYFIQVFQVYTPPRGQGVIEQKLANLLTFLNDDRAYPIDPLLKMAIGHFQFEAIHPFRDGNGRTGRLLNIHYLTQKGLLDYPILYLSRYIVEHKDDYYSTLAGVSQRGDWQQWLLYMLRAVAETATMTYEKINRIIAARDAVLEVVAAQTSIRRPDQLVQKIFTQPTTRVRHLTEDRTYAENTARDYLAKLVELGVLERKIVSGNQYFINRELYSILGE